MLPPAPPTTHALTHPHGKTHSHTGTHTHTHAHSQTHTHIHSTHFGTKKTIPLAIVAVNDHTIYTTLPLITFQLIVVECHIPLLVLLDDVHDVLPLPTYDGIQTIRYALLTEE